MTRKRFVKLLMAYGITRNGANSMAANKPPKEPYWRYLIALVGEGMRIVEMERAGEHETK